MEVIKSVKRYHLNKDRTGWNFTIKQDGMVWGEMFQKDGAYGFNLQEPPELFSELKSLLYTIPSCPISTKIERILVVGCQSVAGYKEGDHIVSLNDSDQYEHDSPEVALWNYLELLAKQIVEKSFK